MEVITRQQCEQTLKNFIKTDTVSFTHLSARPLTGCSGYIGTQYIIQLHYQDGNEDRKTQFFLKKLEKSNSFIIYRMFSEIRGCEKESFFYGILLPLYDSYDLDCNFAPRGYFCDQDLVILEDLSLKSFGEFPKHKLLRLNQCKVCLETLAKFHVAPILYEIKKSKELGRRYTLMEDYSHILQEEFCSGKDFWITKYFRYSVSGLCELVDLIVMPGVDKEGFKCKLKELLEEMFAHKSNYTDFRSTVVHGDVWYGNFLCQNDEEGRTRKCKLIDYHTISYGPLVSDVLLFIFSTTRRNFRKLYFQELLAHYYSFFSSLLENEGIDPSEVLPANDYINECKIFEPSAKIFAAVEHGMTSNTDKSYEEANKTEEMQERFWYEDRPKYIVKSFKEIKEFRELMTEVIIELASS